MLVLCMFNAFRDLYCAQNYAGIIGLGLSEIESEGVLESIYLAIQCVLTCKINVKLRVIRISNYLAIICIAITAPLWHREYSYI